MALVRNRIEFMLLLLATQKVGAIFVPINTELKGAFLEHQLRNCEPKLVFVDAVLAQAFDGVSGGAQPIAAAVFVAGDKPDDMPAVFAGSEQLTFEEFAGRPQAEGDVLVTPSPYDIACIMYTSGTTGPSKGVLMPHAHLYLFGLGTAEALDLTPADRYYVCMPLFHANALLMQVFGSWMRGTPIYCVERFSPNRWLDDVRSSGATVTNALGVMPEFIYRTEPTAHDADNKLRHMMAVPIAEEWGRAMEQRFGVKIMQGYGMTEINIPCYTNDDDPLVPGCAGHVLEDYFEIRVVDPENDESVPVGEVGEIVVRPKEPGCFMQGYFRMPEKTVEAWRNLWFHSGDAGRFDDAGRLYFIDRIKDCIRRRGENISAFEVEQVLNSHPAVAESCVIGVRVEGAGGEEEVKALIVPKSGASIDNVALLDFCVERMPRYAVPRFIELTGELEKTATGKIRKQDLRDAGITPDTWDRETVGYTIARNA
jgi:crotonobetaine/carnitine-CoA ligase